MGIVVRLPLRHARKSTTSRAAKPVSTSAVTPFSEALAVARTADHHSAGTLSRCHHLETAEDLAPISAAIASRDGHRSMMDWKDGKWVMPPPIRQSVLKHKDILSGDVCKTLGHNVLMSSSDSTKVFKDQFTARVAYARHKAGYTQATMAEALGFGPPEDPSAQGKYHKYEKRSFMPHALIPRFCDLCDVTTGWLYSGPAVARPVEKRGRKPKPAPAQRKRARA